MPHAIKTNQTPQGPGNYKDSPEAVFEKIYSQMFDDQEVYSIPTGPDLGEYVGCTTISMSNRTITKIRIRTSKDSRHGMEKVFIEQFDLLDNFIISFEESYGIVRQSNGDFNFRIPNNLEIEKLTGFFKALNSLKQPRNKGGITCAI